MSARYREDSARDHLTGEAGATSRAFASVREPWTHRPTSSTSGSTSSPSNSQTTSFVRRATKECPAISAAADRSGSTSLLATMDDLGVATGVFTGGLDRNTDKLLAICDAHPGRFLVAGGVGDPSRPGRQVRRIRELAQHPAFCMVRVMPLASQVPTNDARHYPVYQVCEELGLPCAINAGIPGPRVRSRVQHPELLEDVLIDFPDLTVIVAHMGHPYEELLMNYMRKWPSLFLSCTAYAPKYMDPNLAAIHEHQDLPGAGAVGQRRTVVPDAALARRGEGLPLDDEAMALFLGGTARRLLARAS